MATDGDERDVNIQKSLFTHEQDHVRERCGDSAVEDGDIDDEEDFDDDDKNEEKDEEAVPANTRRTGDVLLGATANLTSTPAPSSLLEKVKRWKGKEGVINAAPDERDNDALPHGTARRVVDDAIAILEQSFYSLREDDVENTAKKKIGIPTKTKADAETTNPKAIWPCCSINALKDILESNRVRTTDAFFGKLTAHLSLNRLLNGILSYS